MTDKTKATAHALIVRDRRTYFSKTIMSHHTILVLSALLVLGVLVSFGAAQICPEYIQSCRYTRYSLMNDFVRHFEAVGPTVLVSKVVAEYRQYTTRPIRDIFGDKGEILISTCVAGGASVFNVPYMIQNCSCIPTCSDSAYLDAWLGNARRGLTLAQAASEIP